MSVELHNGSWTGDEGYESDYSFVLQCQPRSGKVIVNSWTKEGFKLLVWWWCWVGENFKDWGIGHSCERDFTHVVIWLLLISVWKCLGKGKLDNPKC